MQRSRVTAGGLVAVGLVLAAWSAAQDVPPVKLAFVDVERALFAIDEGRARLKALQDWARPLQEEIAALSQEIASLQAELASKQGGGADAAAADLNRRLVEKQRLLEDKQRRGKRDFEERQDAVLKDLGTRLNEVIVKYADENRYTAVFILKPNELAYLAKSADITDAIIKLYNERFPYQGAK